MCLLSFLGIFIQTIIISVFSSWRSIVAFHLPVCDPQFFFSFFFFLTPMLVNLPLSQAAAEFLFTCIPHIQIPVYCFSLLSLRPASLFLQASLPRFRFILCLSYILTVYPSTPCHEIITYSPEKSFLYFSWPLKRSRNQYEDVKFKLFFSIFCIFLIQLSFSLLYPKIPSKQFYRGCPFRYFIHILKSFHHKISNYTAVKYLVIFLLILYHWSV